MGREMLAKQEFYDKYGVLEMFFYDPDSFDFGGRVRSAPDQPWQSVSNLNVPWSARILGIRFELFDDGLAVFYPDGSEFQDPETAMTERDRAQQERDMAQQERDRALAKLRELGIDPSDLS